MIVVCCSVTITLLSCYFLLFALLSQKLVEKCFIHAVSQKHEILTIKSFAKLKQNCTNKAKVRNMYLK